MMKSEEDQGIEALLINEVVARNLDDKKEKQERIYSLKGMQ